MNVELSRAASLFSPQYQMESKISFVSMELKSHQELFMKLRIEHVPTLLYLPPTTKVQAKDYLNHVKGFDIRRESSGKEPDVTSKRQGDNMLLIMGFLLLMATIGFEYFDLGSRLLQLGRSSFIWSLLSLGFVILMLSGHMWVRIRNAPLLAMGRNGQPLYIAPGHQNQLGVETQILFAINLIASLATVMITKSGKCKNIIIQKLILWICIAAICISFSVELNLFRQKIGGYPFTFLPISIF